MSIANPAIVEDVVLRWEDLRRLQKLAESRKETVADAALFLIQKGVYTPTTQKTPSLA